jgi:hypothetical protein
MSIAQPSADHLRRVFGRYVDAPMWVAWEARPHVDPTKDPIKVPINPNTGFPAKSDDPTTWAPMGKAMAMVQRKGLAGVGIMLGPDPDQNPDRRPDKPFLVGVDYDGALKADGTLMPWAQEMLLGDTYTEVSPSGTGIKAFALVGCRPAGLPDDRDGVKLRLDGIESAPGVTKRPAVEVYTNRRWFAVTGQTFGRCEQIADMSARIPVLLRHARPAPVAAPLPIPGEMDPSFTPQDAREAYAQALTDAARVGLTAALHAHADLAAAMVGADWPDRSGALFTAADLAKGYRLTFEQFVHGIMAAAGAAGSHVREQPDPFRALARAWERSPQPEPITDPGAVPPDARLGDRPGVSGDGYASAVMPTDLSFLDEVNPLGAPYTLPLDLLSNPPPLPKFVLNGLFPAAPTAFVGTGGVLKSTIWMGLALHMLLGRPTWGASWWDGGSALMISKEDERPIMLRRLHDLLHGMNVTERQYRDIVAQRFFIDDWTESGARMVEADRGGNLHATPVVEHLIDKYRGRAVTLAAIDPMVNFGPGEVHGNDGAALMMQVAWRLTRGWGGEGACSVSYIHHLSMAAAREEVEDAHAGRSASAIGDNARSVWVLHRHKLENAHNHVAPDMIPREAIEAGDVIRLKMAKQSYARRVDEPFWVWRDGGALRFVEPLSSAEARAATVAAPTRAEREASDRVTARQAAILSAISQAGPPGLNVAELAQATSLTPRIIRELVGDLRQSGVIADSTRPHAYRIQPQTAAYGF